MGWIPVIVAGVNWETPPPTPFPWGCGHCRMSAEEGGRIPAPQKGQGQGSVPAHHQPRAGDSRLQAGAALPLRWQRGFSCRGGHCCPRRTFLQEARSGAGSHQGDGPMQLVGDPLGCLRRELRVSGSAALSRAPGATQICASVSTNCSWVLRTNNILPSAFTRLHPRGAKK